MTPEEGNYAEHRPEPQKLVSVLSPGHRTSDFSSEPRHGTSDFKIHSLGWGHGSVNKVLVTQA